MGKWAAMARLAAGCALAAGCGEDRQDTPWVEIKPVRALTAEPSRAQLAEREMQSHASVEDRKVRLSFVFPDDAGGGLFGIDVSHYNGTFLWSGLAGKGVSFAYMKASQGATDHDPTFVVNWRGAGEQRLPRGAYHFFSAGVPAGEQARNFLAQIEAAGGLAPGDLAPVLDMEWDLHRVNGQEIDRWTSMSGGQIAAAALEWLTLVEKATGRRPMIYTSASWWNPRVGTAPALTRYPMWIADYRRSSIAAGRPVAVAGHRVAAWQFTSTGLIDGRHGYVDVTEITGGGVGSLKGLPGAG